MSRIGKLPIAVPKGVEVRLEGQNIAVKGPKGALTRMVHESMRLKMENAQLVVLPADEAKPAKNFHGLTRTLVANMVEGVSKGFTRQLVLKGVGYRALVKDRELHLTLGYSHPVVYPLPAGISAKVDKLGNDPMVALDGCDRELVGQTAAVIRGFRKPEPYHGKGVRYADEVIVTKVGKSSGKK